MDEIESKKTPLGLIDIYENSLTELWPIALTRPDLGGADETKGKFN